MSELIDKSKKHTGGPATPEGKHRSSLNSMRHGLTSQTVVLPHEDASKFDELLADYVGQYAPETKLELDLVHELAAIRWRLQRIWGIETTVLDVAAQRNTQRVDQEFKNPPPNLRVALAFMDLAENSRTLSLLNRYESRLARRFHQVLTDLAHLQDRRKEEDPDPATAKRSVEIAESPEDPSTCRVLLTIPKRILRNELEAHRSYARPDDNRPPKREDAA